MVDMLRLPAQLDHPYRIVIAAAADDATLTATLTTPSGTVTALALTPSAGVHAVTVTPAELGAHTVAVTGSDDPAIVGMSFELVVTELRAGDFSAETFPVDDTCSAGCPIRWPAPDFQQMLCVDEYRPLDVRRWVARATAELHRRTSFRFPGCHCYAKIRPRVTGSCLCATPSGSWAFDLFDTLRYPAIELLDVTVDGVSQPLTDWTIEGQRWLVPADGVGWPRQNYDAVDGAAGSWSVTVRYGRTPDPLAVDARDAYAYAMLLSSTRTASGFAACRLPDGTTQISENGRTIVIDPAESVSALLAEAAAAFGPSPWDFSMIVDPAEQTSSASRSARLVPGDHAPLGHRLFLGSGADIDAELAELATPEP